MGCVLPAMQPVEMLEGVLVNLLRRINRSAVNFGNNLCRLRLVFLSFGNRLVHIGGKLGGFSARASTPGSDGPVSIAVSRSLIAFRRSTSVSSLPFTMLICLASSVDTAPSICCSRAGRSIRLKARRSDW